MNRKYIKTFIACIAIVACGSIRVLASEFYPLPVQEAAVNAANWATVIHASDFANFAPTTNTITTTTNSVDGRKLAPFQANSLVQLVGARLIRAFNGSTDTNGLSHTLALSVGDADSATKYVSSWAIHASNTPVYAISPIIGGTASATTTLTLQKVSLTDTNAVTASVVTNATASTSATISPTAGGATLYTVATNLTFTFTGNAEEKVTTNTVGDLILYWRVFKN